MNPTVIKSFRPGNVRLIDEEGNQLGVMTVKDALVIAQDREYDLIEVSPQSDPPVCKLSNYGKLMYEQSKKEKQQSKGKTRKEIKMGPRIADGDLDVKINKTIELIEKENEVFVSVLLKGRERNTPQLATDVLLKFLEKLQSRIAFKTLKSIDNQGNKAEVLITNN